MMNDKKRTGEIWRVTYPKIKGFKYPPDPTLNKKRTYTFKIVRSWKCSKLCGDHYQYKGEILSSTDPKDERGKVVYLGHFFVPHAKMEHINF